MKLIRGLLLQNRCALYPGAPRVPESLMREAFGASREKRYGLARWFYRRLLGPDWDYALLGFAYVKCIDNVADDEADVESALAYLDGHRRLLEKAYAGAVESDLPTPDRFGQLCFQQDAAGGSPLRSCFEDIFDAMEFDVRRRGRVLPSAELEEHLVNTGEPGIRFLTRYISPQLELSRDYLGLVSRAYLWADSLLDLEYDLGHGIINVPAEDVERLGLTPAPDDAGLPRWVEEQSARTLGYFDAAFAETAKLDDASIVLLCNLYLRRKRKKLLRFLDRREIPHVA